MSMKIQKKYPFLYKDIINVRQIKLLATKKKSISWNSTRL